MLPASLTTQLRRTLALTGIVMALMAGLLASTETTADAQPPGSSVIIHSQADVDTLTDPNGTFTVTVSFKIPAGFELHHGSMHAIVDTDLVDYVTVQGQPRCKSKLALWWCTLPSAGNLRYNFFNPGLTTSTKVFKFEMQGQGAYGCGIEVGVNHVVLFHDALAMPIPHTVVSDTIDIPAPGQTC